MRASITSKGFTIVELLIVIVVIAILAAITIVSYNGITYRAQVATTKTDLRNISQRMEIFYADNGRYPDTMNLLFTEIAQVLKDAGLYEKTRSPDGQNGPNTTFIFCRYGNNTRYTVIAIAPLLAGAGVTQAGKQLYFATSENGAQEATFVWDDNITGSGVGGLNACKSVDPSFPLPGGAALWSFHVPTSYAP